MKICFVFLRVKDGFIESVLKEIKEFPGVQEAYNVWTSLHFDIIAKLHADDIDTMTQNLVPKIRKINGVEEDSTSIAIPVNQPE
ncbi:MAG: Lrp/AsnC ligand binding domain-containing protein [Candidatus Hermodarchaeota archaeon]